MKITKNNLALSEPESARLHDLSRLEPNSNRVQIYDITYVMQMQLHEFVPCA
jgi:hypothetical protein